jgi:hypothetical protein
VNFYQEMGGLSGRFLFAVCAIWIVSRRGLMRLFQLPGLIVIPLVYFYAARYDLELLKWGVFVAGLLTIAQFSFWGNYLPRVYPVHLRGTGESFAANIGGRMIGTSAALVTTTLTPYMPGNSTALAAASVGLGVYLIGSIFCFWLPEPAHEELPD